MSLKRQVIQIHRFLRRCVLAGLLLGAVLSEASGQSIDIFSGVELHFKDLDFKRQYDVLINLTPGFKWDMGNHWQLSGQVIVPVFNQYGEDFSGIRPNNLAVSKQLKTGPFYWKATAGLFSHNRYGIDLKTFVPVTEWLAFEAQAGYLGQLFTWPFWYIGRPDRFAGTVGGDIYLKRWNAQLRGVAGWYLYQDYGFEAEAMRHFNHTTVSVYANWNNLTRFDAGFRVVVMIPPYHRKARVVNFRPASNFRLSYTVMFHPYSNVMYKTDPEENERDGWFDRDLLEWGSHTMAPDFILEGKEVEE